MRGMLGRLALGGGGLLLAAMLVLGWGLNVLGVRVALTSGSVAAVFDQPLPYPGYMWSRDGRSVSEFELNTIAGPAHCGWQSATMLHIGWPPGTVAPFATQARQYVRDPKGVLRGSTFRDLLVRSAAVPGDARRTGYRLGTIELYLSPSDEAGIYVVSTSGAERWPRSDPMTGCM